MWTRDGVAAAPRTFDAETYPWIATRLAAGEPIHVPQEAGARELEIYRQRVEQALNEITAKAYALAGADMTRATPPPVAEPAA